MNIKPIAYFHSPLTSKFGLPRQSGLADDLVGRIVLEPEYRREVDFLSTIIRDEWKLVYVMKERRLELYNLKEDIGETRDLSSSYPDKVAELARALGDRLRAWNASMPTDRITGTVVPMPDEI